MPSDHERPNLRIIPGLAGSGVEIDTGGEIVSPARFKLTPQEYAKAERYLEINHQLTLAEDVLMFSSEHLMSALALKNHMAGITDTDEVCSMLIVQATTLGAKNDPVITFKGLGSREEVDQAANRLMSLTNEDMVNLGSPIRIPDQPQ